MDNDDKRVNELSLVLTLVMASFMIGGCNSAQVSQFADALQAASGSGTPSPSPGAVSTDSGTNGATCFYTSTFTYDLGPGIDVNESFEVTGRYHGGVQVVELVTSSSALGCPENVMIPAEGDSRQSEVAEVLSEGGQLSLFATHHSQPTVLQESFSGLSMTPQQITNGIETQIFQGGSLTSAQGNSDAKMIVQVTFVYAQSQPNQNDLRW